MFRASMCPSSGELIVSLRHLVYVTLYRRPFGVQVWMGLSYHTWYNIWWEAEIVKFLILLNLLLVWRHNYRLRRYEEKRNESLKASVKMHLNQTVTEVQLHFSPQFLYVLWGPTLVPIQPVPVKLAGREADHSCQSSIEAKNEWSYTSTPPICLHGVDRDKISVSRQ
jgi:hypothetical protein